MSDGKSKDGENLSKSNSKEATASKDNKDKNATKSVAGQSSSKTQNEGNGATTVDKVKQATSSVAARNDEKANAVKEGQRYYLYDKELKRPTETPRIFPSFSKPYRPRLPFHMHDYVGIYPTADDARFEQELLAKRRREYLIYTRPPDVYHGSSSSLSASQSVRSDVYNGERRRRDAFESSRSRRRDYDYSSHDYRDRDRDYYSRSERSYGSSHHRISDSFLSRRPRDYYHSSSTRRRHSHGSPPRSRTRSHSGERGKPELTKEKEQNEFDLSVELHPMMHFIDDKPKLLKEALSILKGKKLETMVPPMFADLNAREVEEICLNELNTLNIATIANVMDGKLLNTELTNSVAKPTKSKKAGVSVTKIKKRLKQTIPDDPSPKKKKKRKSSADLESKKSKKKHKKKKKKKSEDDVPAGPGLPPQKTLMELLELEYRAKAIKALLKSQDINVDSSKIDEALNVDQDGFDPGTRPIVADPRPLAVPEISTRFLVDNTYIYPMQIKLEFEEPEPEIVIDETTFPPSPEPPLPVTVTTEVSEENEGEVRGQTENTSDIDRSDNAEITLRLNDNAVLNPENGDIGVCTSSNLRFKTSMVISLEDDSDDSEDEQEPVSLHVQNAADAASRADERAKILELCQSDDTVVTADVMETNEMSELEDGECGDEEEQEEEEQDEVEKEQDEVEAEPDSEPERCEIVIKKPEQIQIEVEDIGSTDEDEDDGVAQTYVRHCPNGPGTTPMDQNPSRDISPPRKHIFTRPVPFPFRPEPTTSSHLSAEDISSDESGDQLLEDDGIVIGGFDPAADQDKDDDILTLPPLPFHTCEPRPEGYESTEEQDEDEDEDTSTSAGNQYEEEDEDTNPRTWFNRWYNTKKVQKNVRMNRMIGKLRTKLRREKVIPEPLPPEPSEEAVPIIGSISEYQTLFSSGKFKPLPENDIVEETAEQNVAEQEPAEEDNNANDDLWGDILG